MPHTVCNTAFHDESDEEGFQGASQAALPFQTCELEEMAATVTPTTAAPQDNPSAPLPDDRTGYLFS